MQLDIDDWKTREEFLPSLNSFWEDFTKDLKWYRYHPRFVHKDYRSMVIQSLHGINLIEISAREIDSVDEWIEVLMEGKYSSDSQFKNQCRIHQSRFRANVLGVWFDEDINILKIVDGKSGLNFYDGFGIRKLVKKIQFRKPFHCNLLRSEHLPYNLFIPLDQNKDYGRLVFNDLLGEIIDRILVIEIEYAPKPKENYLDDHTSFDTYIQYHHTDGSLGILGIEVKYTEGSYPLKVGSTEHDRMTKTFNASKYKEITEQSGRFQLKEGDFDQLKLDRYRQVWRNHLLGESMLLEKDSKYHHFHSITIYPSGNTHFTDVILEYREVFLKPEVQEVVQGMTFD